MADSTLWTLLSKVDPSAQFCSFGKVPIVLPGLTVDGVGAVALPVTEANARALIARASQAPYGRGAETIIDTSIRKVWQLEPSQFRLDNHAWGTLVESVVDRVKQDFALKGAVKATLYKLLVYEKGSFFAPHRDSEKEARMFATLVISLPSRHEGGALIVNHGDRSTRIEFGGPANDFDVQYAAFYADCEHVIEPLKKGYRICLVYNLAQTGARQPAPPQVGTHASKVSDCLGRLFDAGQDRVAVCLQHQYTRPGLTWDGLKGWDRACLAVLSEAADLAGCDVHLAQLKWEQSGQADDDGGFERYGDDDDADMTELDEETITITGFVPRNGAAPVLDTLHLSPEEVVSKGGLDGLPVRQSVSRTGNEGTTVDRWYDGAAVVLWPRCREMDMVGREGHKVALPVLKSLAGDVARVDVAQRLAASIMDHWDVQHDYAPPNFVPSKVMLKCLQALDDPRLAARFIREILPRTCVGSEGKALTSLCKRLGWTSLAPALKAFLAAQRKYDGGEAWRAALAVFRDLCCPGDSSTERVQACGQMAPGLDSLMAHWDEADRWGSMGRDGVLEIFFQSLGAIDRVDVLDTLLERALADPKRYDLYKVLLPAVKALAPPAAPVQRAFMRLHEHCVTQLAERTPEPVRFPTDWSMEVAISCRCADCKELQVFLRDAEQRTWSYRAREERRQHLSERLGGTDVRCAIERKKPPYTLVCTKTRASYENRQKQYEEDCRWLQELESLAVAGLGRGKSRTAATPTGGPGRRKAGRW